MANLYGLDAAGNAAYVKATGAGTNGDPFIVNHDLISSELKSAFVSASGNVDVVAAVSGSKLRVMAMTITTFSGCTVKLQSGASTDKTPPFHFGDNGNLTQSNPLGLFDSIASEKINAVVSGSTVYTVMLSYREVPT
jgi:spore coat protein U-like protein